MGIRIDCFRRRSKKKTRARKPRQLGPIQLKREIEKARQENRNILEYAYGVLGLSVEELAGLTPFNFEIKCAGFRNNKKMDESLFRKLAWFMVATTSSTNPTNAINDNFPSMYGDNKQNSRYFTKREMISKLERYSAIKQRILGNNIIN